MDDNNHIHNEPRFDDATGQYTTGHSWDGIEELNTPMPRWWLGIFYLSILFGIVYMILMPAIPLLNTYTSGVLGKSDRAAVAQDMKELKSSRSELSNKLLDADLETIQGDPELFRFAMAAGKSAFGDNCATCHGAGGQGFKGYPNLNDDVWLWGGTFKDIRHTLEVGIRAGHEDTRISLMSAYGRDGFLTGDQINDVVEYVLSINHHKNESDDDHIVSAEAAERGRNLYNENCVSCHGKDGLGDQSQGAPNLTDNEWLYGGEPSDIYETLWNGRQGVMPNWNERLDPATVTALAVYVHGLGGGEATQPMTMPAETLEDP